MKRGAWDIPGHEIEALAACFLPDILEFIEAEKYRKQQAEEQRTNAESADPSE